MAGLGEYGFIQVAAAQTLKVQNDFFKSGFLYSFDNILNFFIVGKKFEFGYRDFYSRGIFFTPDAEIRKSHARQDILALFNFAQVFLGNGCSVR